MFIINFNFIKPMEEVNSFTEQHREYVSNQYKKGIFIIGGPKDPRSGGIVIANSDSEEELREILENDPLIIQKVAEYNLIKFTPLMSNENLKFLLNNKK